MGRCDWTDLAVYGPLTVGIFWGSCVARTGDSRIAAAVCTVFLAARIIAWVVERRASV